MIDAKPEEIAFSGNASEAINTLVESLEVNPGDNIVLNDLEYASVSLPWIKMSKEIGVEVRLVRSKYGVINPKDIEEQINNRTCLVALSHVSYLNGFRHDLSKIRELTKQKKVPLLVDATQSLGVIPVNSKYFDMMVSSSYKWLLGMHGLGVIYIDEKFSENTIPSRIGWRSVKTIFNKKRFSEYELKDDTRKFETGYNNYPGLYVLKNSTNFLLNLSIEKIEKHVLDLGDYLIKALEEQGWKILSSPNRKERSGNISFTALDGKRIMKELERRNIKVWGGDGRVRISIHAFNTIKDIEKLIKELEFIRHNLNS